MLPSWLPKTLWWGGEHRFGDLLRTSILGSLFGTSWLHIGTLLVQVRSFVVVFDAISVPIPPLLPQFVD